MKCDKVSHPGGCLIFVAVTCELTRGAVWLTYGPESQRVYSTGKEEAKQVDASVQLRSRAERRELQLQPIQSPPRQRHFTASAL